MITLSRWLAPAVVAVGLGFGSMAAVPVHAQDMTRVLVDVADVVLRGGQPYYRYGHYRDADRLVVGRDRYGRPVYYRLVRVDRGRYHDHGRYYDDYQRNPYDTRYLTTRSVKCNKHGNCKVTYYDPRYDRRGAWDRSWDDDGRRYDGRRDDRRGHRGDHDDD